MSEKKGRRIFKSVEVLIGFENPAPFFFARRFGVKPPGTKKQDIALALMFGARDSIKRAAHWSIAGKKLGKSRFTKRGHRW